MKAAVVSAAGENPAYAEFADPVEVAGRRTVDLVAAGVHPVVRSLISGAHYGSSGRFPAVPGVDCVARANDGTLIYTGYPPPPYGTLAERISVPAGMGVPIPAGADPVLVAGGVNPGLSTWLPLQGLDRPAEATVLITAVTGVAGRLAVQNARALGVGRVLAVARDQRALTDLGADGTAALTGDPAADVAAIEQVLDGSAPDLVLDLAWGWVAEAIVGALVSHQLDDVAQPTRYVHIGAVAGRTAAIDGAALRSRPLQIVGNGAGSADLRVLMAQIPIYLTMIADGVVTPRVREFELSDIAAAWQPETDGRRHVVTP